MADCVLTDLLNELQDSSVYTAPCLMTTFNFLLLFFQKNQSHPLMSPSHTAVLLVLSLG